MGVVIEHTGIAAPHSRRLRPSSIALAARASLVALAPESLDAIDLFIHAGVYRDDHICEPAVAALVLGAIQRRAGAAPASLPGVFAFDLSNGAAGMLNAFHTADALLRARSGGPALVVASDVDPGPATTAGCDFVPLAGAALLREVPGEPGFAAFRFDTIAGADGGREGRLDWVARSLSRERIGTTLRFSIRESAGFRRRAAAAAGSCLRAFLADRGLTADDVDLLIAPSWPVGFADLLADAAGIGRDRVAVGAETAYSAGPVAGIAVAVADGRFAAAREVFFAAVGAGISVALAHYRNPPGAAPESRHST